MVAPRIFSLLSLVVMFLPGLALAKRYELVQDPNYERGFEVTFGAEGNAPKKVYDIGNSPAKGPPVWQIMQWHSRASLPQNPEPARGGEGDRWKNDYKSFVRKDGKVQLAMNSHKEWGDYLASPAWKALVAKNPGLGAKPFESGGKPLGALPSNLGLSGWPALLIGQGFAPNNRPTYPAISALKHIYLDFTARLVRIDRPLPETLPHPMAAQVPLFFSVQNLTAGQAGFGQYILISVPVFDSRYEFTAAASMLDPGLGAFMYGTASKAWSAESLFTKKPVHFEGDAIEFVRASLKNAMDTGKLTDKDPSHYFVSGFNVGWEMPGLYDAEVEFGPFHLSLEDGAK